MSERRTAAFLVLLVYYWTPLKGGETEVSCVLLESCVLPCSFDPGPDPVIHWFKEPDQTTVHSYYRGKNQFEHQHQNFTGRTSLFEKEFSTGNSSLLLSEVRGHDEGRYMCYVDTTRGSRESYVRVKVHAPVLQVALQQEAEQLLCRSEGVFPKPSVSWTPSSAAEPTFKSSESGVWSVLSSVSLPHSPPHEYSCNVSTPHSWRSATYRRNIDIHVSASQATIVPCSKSKTPVKSLIWRFNHSQTIVTRSGPEPVYTESWRWFVDGVTESNTLILKGLTKDQQGLFSCELSTEHETFIIHTQVTESGESNNTYFWLILCGALLSLTFICLVLFFWWRHCEVSPAPRRTEHQSINLMKEVEMEKRERKRMEEMKEMEMKKMKEMEGQIHIFPMVSYGLEP